MILYLRVYIYILFKGGLCSKGKQLFFRVKASLWHVRASYLLFCCEGGQVPVGKGKHDLNADSYKTGETQSDSDNRSWEPKQREEWPWDQSLPQGIGGRKQLYLLQQEGRRRLVLLVWAGASLWGEHAWEVEVPLSMQSSSLWDPQWISCEEGGSTRGELHILLAMLPREGFILVKCMKVLIFKRGVGQFSGRAPTKQERGLGPCFK